MDHFGLGTSEDLLRKLGVDFRGAGTRRNAPLPPVPAGSDTVDEWGVGDVMFDHGHGGSVGAALR